MYARYSDWLAKMSEEMQMQEGRNGISDRRDNLGGHLDVTASV
jgi:hypothetical protein